MPLIDAQPDALAKVYASSLYDLADKQGGRDLVEDVLGSLEGVLELARQDPRFSEFLSSRVLRTRDREKALRAILEGKVDDLVLRFLLVVNRKNRLGHLPAIFSAFDEIVQDKFGRVEVNVITAQPLDADQLSSIRDRLAKTLNKDVIAHPSVDPSIIGGVRFRIGDQLVDASVATRLRRMRDMLTDHGAAEIKARAGRMIDRSE